MSKKKLRRIAFVRLSPMGKSYPMRCDREDLEVGDDVVICLHADTPQACRMNGTITDVSYQRWECRSLVIQHVNEISPDFQLLLAGDEATPPVQSKVVDFHKWQTRRAKSIH